MTSEVRQLPRPLRDIAVCAGPGPGRAEACAKKMIGEGADILVSFGVAGALSDDLEVGDLILPSKVTDAVREELMPVAKVPLATDAKRDLHLLTVAVPAVGVAEKQDLARRYRAQLVDMESARIALLAKQHRCGFLCVRVISDGLFDQVPKGLLNALGEDGSVNFGKLLRELLRRPYLVASLLSLARQYRMSLRRLREAGNALQAWTSQPELVKQWYQQQKMES